MPSHPHNAPLRASQRPGAHPNREDVTSNAPYLARSPPNAPSNDTRSEGTSVRHSNAIGREVIVARPPERRDALGPSLRSDHDHRNA